jgi:dienelactone hydrolase
MLISTLLCACLASTFPALQTQTGPQAAQAAPQAEMPVPPAAPPDPHPITDLLVLDPVGRRVRAALQPDPVEALLARGIAPKPREGVELAVGDGRTRTWRKLTSAEGAFSDPALRGGWAYAHVESPTERVLLLYAVGHAAVYVDGVPRGGDPYGLGIVRTPIVVRPGGTDLHFKAGDGELRAALLTPPAKVFIEKSDATLPDVVRGQLVDSFGAVVVTNATAQTQLDVLIHCALEQGDSQALLSFVRIPELVPLEIRKQTLPLPLRLDVQEGLTEVTLVVTATQVDTKDRNLQHVLHQERFTLRVRASTESHVQGFQSSIDESAQTYAVVPASPPAMDPAVRPGLVLSLHGAGVEARAQAENLTPRAWAHSVAPSNRRPYGFDWEDWGRLDALEVLLDAGTKLGIDPKRVGLSGHSMGGHGAWLLGSQHPGLFAAVAPSAGWRDFWTYSGAWKPADGDAVQELFARAANVSKLEPVLPNLATRGVYVLHGDADDTVSVEEARAMRAKLAEFHPDFAYREQAGAGHWWGSNSVDWPPLYDFLEGRSLPADADVRALRFTSVNPTVAWRMHWANLEAQHRSLQPSTIDARLLPERRRFIIKTENVSRLLIDLSQLGFPRGEQPATLPAEQEFSVFIDGQELGIDWPQGARELRLQQRLPGGDWLPMGPVAPRWKSPLRAGPFKEAFRNRMIFVYATGGTPEENAWSLAKARYDLEVWRYRANGSALLLADTRYMTMNAAAKSEHNLILYGHADANQAWKALPADCPIEVRRGLVRVGERRLQRDDLGCIFTFPTEAGPGVAAAVICGSGPVGARLTDALPYFTSGAAYPDWTVLAPEILSAGAAGVLGTGFFGYDWSLERGESAWVPAVQPGK